MRIMSTRLPFAVAAPPEDLDMFIEGDTKVKVGKECTLIRVGPCACMEVPLASSKNVEALAQNIVQNVEVPVKKIKGI